MIRTANYFLYNVFASNYITCIKCNAYIHIKCMHSVGIIKNSWSNSNKPLAYALSILNSGNIHYVCESCKQNVSIHNVTPPSQITIV